MLLLLGATAENCLCTFDVDRTLTGSQENTKDCPDNEVMWNIRDNAYSPGALTISQLGQKLTDTFCNDCYIGVITAGDAGGTNSKERAELMRRFSALPNAVYLGDWSQTCWNVKGPLVYSCQDGQKHQAVGGILAWYKSNHDIEISPDQVWHFDDRQSNISPFSNTAYNARMISCDTRDTRWAVGLCGATTSEIQKTKGVHICGSDPVSGCTSEGSDPWASGSFVECCAGSKKCLERSAGWAYRCKNCDSSCPDDRSWNGRSCATARGFSAARKAATE